MNGKFIGGVLLVLVLILGAVIVGAYAYTAGVAQGIAESGKLPATGIAPYPYGYHPFGWGFGFLGCFAPILLVFLLMMLMRAFFWHGPRWGMYRHWGKEGYGARDVPPMFEEWHKRAHETERKSEN